MERKRRAHSRQDLPSLFSLTKDMHVASYYTKQESINQMNVGHKLTPEHQLRVTCLSNLLF
jgi:hypothetical protein